MIHFLRLLLLISWLTTTACSHVQFAPKSRQGLMLLALPPTAQIWVDHRYWGTGIEMERIPRLLSVGRHELVIVAPGHYPTYPPSRPDRTNRRPAAPRWSGPSRSDRWNDPTASAPPPAPPRFSRSP